MSIHEHFERIRQEEREKTLHHFKSVIHNQLERVRVGVQEAGEEDLEEDYEALEKLVNRLLDEFVK